MFGFEDQSEFIESFVHLILLIVFNYLFTIYIGLFAKLNLLVYATLTSDIIWNLLAFWIYF